MLKKLVMGTALATLMAAPAFAQAFNPGWGTGNNTPSYYDAQGQLHAGLVRQSGRHAFAVAPRGAYAYVPGHAGVMGRFDRVYDSGHYAGQDPDPNVRLDLRRDIPAAY